MALHIQETSPKVAEIVAACPGVTPANVVFFLNDGFILGWEKTPEKITAVYSVCGLTPPPPPPPPVKK